MYGHLSLDVICSEIKVSFQEPIISEDNYPYILSRHIEDIIYSQILLTGLDLQSSRWNRKFNQTAWRKEREIVGKD